MSEKTAAYQLVQVPNKRRAKKRQSLLGNVLWGGAIGAPLGAGLLGAYGASQGAAEGYRQGAHHARKALELHASDAPMPMIDEQMELADKVGPGAQAWKGFKGSFWPGALAGGGTGVAIGLLKYLLSR